MGVVEDGKRRTKLEGEEQANKKNTAPPVLPAGDSYRSMGAKDRSMETIRFRIGTGIILDSIPLSHTYRVATNLIGAPIVCQALQSVVSGNPFGGSIVSYPIGADVIVAYNNTINLGIILGGYTPIHGLERFSYRTILSGVVRRYAEDDYTHYGIFTNYKNGTANGSYHADEFGIDEHTDVPEWGMSFINGVRVFADPYMILIGTDEYTGLSLFYRDSLLRLSAINYQVRTFGREEEYLVDNKEYIEYKGSCIMPYEQLGYPYKPTGKEIIHENEDRDEWYKPNSVICPQEPVVKNIQPFHRIMELGGWLGQGKLTQIMAPRPDEPYMEYNKDNKEKHSVARTQVDVSGRVAIASTKGISITKDGCIPAFTRKCRPDEISKDEGDNKDNYNHADLQRPKEIKHKGAISDSMQEAIGIQDYHGYNKNWNEVFQIAYHTDDYQFPEESDLKHKSVASPLYSTLQDKYLLPEEDKYKLNIDSDREYNEYTQNEAGIHLLPSGGIVIYDGSGSEIRFVKGQITISCAGDVNIKPGRNLNLWAGNDLIAKSNKYMDLSSSNDSIRVKAEKKLELLGCNTGNGGVIIESKSSSNTYDFSALGEDIETSGIVLKSKNSPVALIGDVAYIRCGDGENPGKGIFLDAGGGNMDICCIANTIKEYIIDSHTINFDNQTPDSIDATTSFSKNMTTIVGHTIITDDVVMDGRIVMSNDLVCCGTITSFGNQSGLISPFGVDTKDEYIKYINDNVIIPYEALPEVYVDVYNIQILPLLYEEQRIGNDEVLSGLSFSFRTDEQLALPEDYYIYEDLWQHIALNGEYGAPSMWEENSVVCMAGTTYPFPGKDKYENPTFVTQESTIVDYNNRIYIDRKVSNHATAPGEDRYKEPEYSEQVKKPLNFYPII